MPEITKDLVWEIYKQYPKEIEDIITISGISRTEEPKQTHTDTTLPDGLYCGIIVPSYDFNPNIPLDRMPNMMIENINNIWYTIGKFIDKDDPIKTEYFNKYCSDLNFNGTIDRSIGTYETTTDELNNTFIYYSQHLHVNNASPINFNMRFVRRTTNNDDEIMDTYVDLYDVIIFNATYTFGPGDELYNNESILYFGAREITQPLTVTIRRN